MGLNNGLNVNATGGRPTVRNPLMTQLLPYGLIFGVNILAGILMAVTDVGAFSFLGTIGSLAGSALAIIALIKMVNELKAVTGNVQFAWWPVFVPFYNIYWAVALLPQEVTKAKQMRNVQQPTRNVVLYLFFYLYALAADLNDIAKAP